MEPASSAQAIIEARHSANQRLIELLARLSQSQFYLTGNEIQHPPLKDGPGSDESFLSTMGAQSETLDYLITWLGDLVVQSESFTGTSNAQRG